MLCILYRYGEFYIPGTLGFLQQQYFKFRITLKGVFKNKRRGGGRGCEVLIGQKSSKVKTRMHSIIE